jgi:hypothetical protein
MYVGQKKETAFSKQMTRFCCISAADENENELNDSKFFLRGQKPSGLAYCTWHRQRNCPKVRTQSMAKLLFLCVQLL